MAKCLFQRSPLLEIMLRIIREIGVNKAFPDILHRLAGGVNHVLGIEPVVGYLQAKETEVMNLRMILTGKISGMDDALIKERLRDTYV